MAGFTLRDMQEFALGNRPRRKKKHDMLLRSNNEVHYSYRGNTIGIFNPQAKKLILSDAGWRSRTTKQRLNQLRPSERIIQRQFDWFVEGIGKRRKWMGQEEIQLW